LGRIIFSKHALRRARERGVDDNEVINTVEEPVEVVMLNMVGRLVSNILIVIT